MRPSKREAALEAALRIVRRDGVTALSYEAIAAEAGLTKGGLLYHFGSREDLLHQLHTYAAGRWEQAIEAEAGAAWDGCDEQTRFAAYARSSQSPDPADLLLMLEASKDPEVYRIWEDVLRRWAVTAPAGGGGGTATTAEEPGAAEPEAADPVVSRCCHGRVTGHDAPRDVQASGDAGSAPTGVSDGGTDQELDAFVARLAADGLWLYESLEPRPLEPELRGRVAEAIVRLRRRPVDCCCTESG